MQQHAYQMALNSSFCLTAEQSKYIEGAIAFIIDRSERVSELVEFMETGAFSDDFYLLPKVIRAEDMNVPFKLQLNYLFLFDPSMMVQWHDLSKTLMYKNYNLLMGDDFRKFFDGLNEVLILSRMASELTDNVLDTYIPKIELINNFILNKMNDAEIYKEVIKEMIRSINSISKQIISMRRRMSFDQRMGNMTSTDTKRN